MPKHGHSKGSTVFIDKAHHNYHTAFQRYAPLSKVLASDGYVVKEIQERFTEDLLRNVDILVIANALDSLNLGNWRLPVLSAFTPQERTVIKNWVMAGGSLFLIADHFPFAGAAQALAAEFGFGFGNCFALDNRQRIIEIFTKSNGSLLNSPLTKAIDTVVTFTGSAFTMPKEAVPVLKLQHYTLMFPRRAWEFDDSTPYSDSKGYYQLAYRTFGRGKVVVSAEAGMFTAQIAEGNSVGFNHPVARQNITLLLNLIHWLDKR